MAKCVPEGAFMGRLRPAPPSSVTVVAERESYANSPRDDALDAGTDGFLLKRAAPRS